MTRQLDRLTALNAQRLIRQGKPSRYHDGGGLYLDVKGAGEGFWLFRYGRGGSKSISFGPAHAVGLTGARAKRKAAHALLADGRDPKIEREQIRMAAKVEAAKRVTFTRRLTLSMPTTIRPGAALGTRPSGANRSPPMPSR